MPKIIDNAKEQIMEAAKRLAAEKPYAGISMRAVAAECGVSVGTIYNYFKDKEMLMAAMMLEDWLQVLRAMQPVCESAATPSVAFACIYHGLREYQQRYASIFADEAAEAAYHTAAWSYHEMLSAQLTALLRPVSERTVPGDTFLVEFAAEALLMWTLRGRTLEEIDGMLCRLYGKGAGSRQTDRH